ncbi:hypothetical protein OSTOST_14569 [Ostertagia ostertagi]
MSHSLVDVQWMNGTIEEKIPGYLLIPHDPDLDQQDHLPGVKELGEEECILFDIMAHPNYKRLFVGNYGVSIHHPSNDMRDIAFQVVADLKNGKQLVRFLNGTQEELWPFDILPINFVDESLDSDSEEDDVSTTEGDLSRDSTVTSAILMEATNILRRLGLYSCKDHQVADLAEIANVVARFMKNSPELEDFLKDCNPDDIEAKNTKILFAGVVLEVSLQILLLQLLVSKAHHTSNRFCDFADVMIAVYRSRALPDNFDIQLLSCFVEDCERREACIGNLPLPEDDMIPLLLEA